MRRAVDAAGAGTCVEQVGRQRADLADRRLQVACRRSGDLPAQGRHARLLGAVADGHDPAPGHSPTPPRRARRESLSVTRCATGPEDDNPTRTAASTWAASRGGSPPTRRSSASLRMSPPDGVRAADGVGQRRQRCAERLDAGLGGVLEVGDPNRHRVGGFGRPAPVAPPLDGHRGRPPGRRGLGGGREPAEARTPSCGEDPCQDGGEHAQEDDGSPQRPAPGSERPGARREGGAQHHPGPRGGALPRPRPRRSAGSRPRLQPWPGPRPSRRRRPATGPGRSGSSRPRRAPPGAPRRPSRAAAPGPGPAARGRAGTRGHRRTPPAGRPCAPPRPEAPCPARPRPPGRAPPR